MHHLKQMTNTKATLTGSFFIFKGLNLFAFDVSYDYK